MNELECMRLLDQQISQVDEAARSRIVSWLADKYMAKKSAPLVAGAADQKAISIESGEIRGIAKTSASGEVQLTVRDFKGRSANDVATRLVHVLVWATRRLTDAPFASSRHSIVPALRRYRCYDGNTRAVLARDKGLVRDGDNLSLDFHANELAEKFVAEILDANVEGRWRPGATKRRSATKAPPEGRVHD